MRSLIDAGLVTLIDPLTAMSPELNERFVDMVDEWLAHRPTNEPPALPMRVHVGKARIGSASSYAVAGWQGRATTSRWMYVEGRVAAAYLMALAADLCRYRSDMEPVTDQPRLFDIRSRTAETPTTDELFDAMRGVVLDAVLPSPEHRVPAEDLASFKEQAGGQLDQFRRP
jgi:hypothetical protein